MIGVPLFPFPSLLDLPELTGESSLKEGGLGGVALVPVPFPFGMIQEQSMSAHKSKHVRNMVGKNKVILPRPDIVADRNAVDMLLKFFGYPALLTRSALESLIFRERQARDKKERECRTSSQ